MYKREIKTTLDGSTTFFWTEKNEHFHSSHGAIQESNHIFIENGLKRVLEKNSEIKILEIGFGTGLNALLSFICIEKRPVSIEYHGIEAFPINEEEHKLLNFQSILGGNSEVLFQSIFNAEWEKPIRLSSNFLLAKKHVSMETFEPEKKYFDLIYFDAFAPDIQPELWNEVIFQKLFDSLKSGGYFLTYSCKGIVKRALKAVGFEVELLPGPPGKRHILRAKKP